MSLSVVMMKGKEMKEGIAEFSVPSLFDDLSDVELAYVFADKENIDTPQLQPWQPLPSFVPRCVTPVPEAKLFADADEEVFKRMYEMTDEIGEVELFLRTCHEFFGQSWQTLPDLRFVAFSYLQLSAAKELTSPQLMAKCGSSKLQGTWFPYWQVGFHASVHGGKEYKYRLAPDFFGLPSSPRCEKK